MIQEDIPPQVPALIQGQDLTAEAQEHGMTLEEYRHHRDEIVRTLFGEVGSIIHGKLLYPY